MAELPPTKKYVLNRDYAATTRLNSQFYLWKSELGYNLHPRIPTPPPDARIADVATGSGVWLLDLARELPGRRLDGFDISLAQVPPLHWLPTNISFREWDMLSEVPNDLIGKYDVVHIRLVILAVNSKQAVQLISNVARMLKPGGYIQWEELNVFGAFVAAKEGVTPTAQFKSAQELADTSKMEWLNHVPMLMSQEFSEAEAFHVECDLSLAKYYQDIQLVVMKEEADNRFADQPEKQEAIYQSIQSVHEESKKGLARCTPKVVFVARKLLDAQVNKHITA